MTRMHESCSPGGGGGTPHIKGGGMLVGNFELTPKGDRLGRDRSFFFLTPKRDQKNIHIKYILLYFFACNPKRDLHG